MKRTYRAAAIAVLAITTAVACGGEEGGDGAGPGAAKKITLVQGVANEPFYISMYCGAKDEAAKMGVTLDVAAPDAWDVAKQTSVVSGVGAKRPDAVLIAPVHETAMAGPVKQLESAGSKVILVDTTLKDESIGLSRISSDNRLGGQQAAQTLAQLIGDKGKVMVISVPVGTPTTDARVEGFKEEIDKHPNIQLVKTEFVPDEAARATAAVQAALAAHPDMAGIFAANLVTGQGVGTALKNTGKVGKTKFVGFDASPKQVEDLRAGTVQALIAQEPLEIGAEGIRQAVAAIEGKEVQKEIKTKMVSVTLETINDPDVSKYLYKSSC